MNIKLCFHVIGTFLKLFGLLLLVPAVFSYIYHDGDLYIFFLTPLITVTSGLLLERAFCGFANTEVLERREAFLIAFLCWICAAVFGALPYLFIEPLSNPADALFESVSGFTTTGATVLSDIESLPHGILFYRSFTQWLGGMGIIILGIAILPKLSVGGIQLMGTEAPGPVTEKITPKIAHTAKRLWLVYLAMSLIFIALLNISGMPLFDSIATSFSTLSTGGFSVKNTSIESYGSSNIELLVTLFMFLGGVNFLLHYYSLSGKFSKVIRNSELRVYAILVVIFSLLLTINLWHMEYQSFFEALRHSVFQVVSIISTTGFSSANFDLWPSFSIFILLLLMFVGACAGSTSGSVKVLRIQILFKRILSVEIGRLVSPRAVSVLKVDNKMVSDKTISSVTGFILLYVSIFVLSVLVLLFLEDISIIGALSASAASIGNVGPGFQEFGTFQNYGFLSGFSKVWLSFTMLIGRLEIFTVLVIFSPVFWRK